MNEISNVESTEIIEYNLEYNFDMDEFLHNRDKYIKLDENFWGSADGIMKLFPNVINESQSAGAYRVIFNKSLGELQKAKGYPGCFRGSVVSNGKIVESARLQPVSLAPQAVAGLFNAMSIVTGQYYMSQINNKIAAVEKGIEDIKFFLDNERISGIETDKEELEEIISSLADILSNDIKRMDKNSSLSRIKSHTVSNIKSYMREINRDIDELVRVKERKKGETLIREIQGKIELLYFLVSEYSAIIQIKVILENDYLNINKAKEKINHYVDAYNAYTSKCLARIDSFLLESKAYNAGSIVNNVKKLTRVPEINVKMSSHNVIGMVANGISGIATGIHNLGEFAEYNIEEKDKARTELRSECYEIFKVRENPVKHFDEFAQVINGNLECVKYNDELYLKAR